MDLIHPLRSQTISFQEEQQTSIEVNRCHLFEDYLFLQAEEQKRQVEELRTGVKIDYRGKGSFDEKRLADHYQISLKSMYAIIKRGCTTESQMTFLEPTKGVGMQKLFTRVGYEVLLLDAFRTSCTCFECEEGACKKFRYVVNPGCEKRPVVL